VERRRPPEEVLPKPSELAEAMDTRSMKLMRRDMMLREKNSETIARFYDQHSSRQPSLAARKQGGIRVGKRIEPLCRIC
jgi:hypothetical protein